MMIEIPLLINHKKMLLRSNVTDSLKTVQYELCEWHTWTDPKTKETKAEWRPFHWYGSLIGALDCIMQLRVATSDATTLKEAIKIIEETRQQLLKDFSTELFPNGKKVSQT